MDNDGANTSEALRPAEISCLVLSEISSHNVTRTRVDVSTLVLLLAPIHVPSVCSKFLSSTGGMTTDNQPSFNCCGRGYSMSLEQMTRSGHF